MKKLIRHRPKRANRRSLPETQFRRMQARRSSNLDRNLKTV